MALSVLGQSNSRLAILLAERIERIETVCKIRLVSYQILGLFVERISRTVWYSRLFEANREIPFRFYRCTALCKLLILTIRGEFRVKWVIIFHIK